MKMKTVARFERNANALDTQVCEIDAIHELPASEYQAFTQNMLADCDFIREHQDIMHVDREGVAHCLLVMGAGLPDGVLINTEGYAYARYTAILPNARLIMEAGQRFPCIKVLEQRLADACDEVIACTMAREDTEPHRVLLCEIAQQHGFEEAYIPLFSEMLGEHPGEFAFECDKDELIISRILHYFSKLSGETDENERLGMG